MEGSANLFRLGYIALQNGVDNEVRRIMEG